MVTRSFHPSTLQTFFDGGKQAKHIVHLASVSESQPRLFGMPIKERRTVETKKLFQIDIGIDKKGRYIGQVLILSDKKGIAYSAPSLKVLIPKLKKAILQKDRSMRLFPLPAESLILDPTGHKMLLT